jgi:hypothetical protein
MARPAHNHDRWFFIQLHRWFPSVLQVLTISGPRRWCVGIGLAFAAIGGGNRVDREGDLSKANCSSLGLASPNQPWPSIW